MTINLGSGVQPSSMNSCNYILLLTSQPTDYGSATGTALVRCRKAVTLFPSAPSGSDVVAIAASAVPVVNQSGTVAFWAAVNSTTFKFLASGPLSVPLAVTMGQTVDVSGFTLTIPASGPASSTSVSAALTPAVVAALNKISGDDQGGSVGQAQVAPMVVQALDASGNPISGATISWTCDGGSVNPPTSTTDGSGNASATFTQAAAPRTNLITASSGGVSAVFTQTSHMVLYGAYSSFPKLLKAAGPGDPLAGVGFLPDTGDVWVPIPGATDEFTGAAIDPAKWRLTLPGGYDHYNDELERYVPSGVTLGNGTLKLTAHARPYDPYATGYVRFTGNPAANDWFKLCGTAITFVASGAIGTQCNIGPDLTTTLQNLFTMLQASTDSNLVKFAYALASDRINLTSAVADVAGVSLTLAYSSSVIHISADYLTGGPGHAPSPSGFKYPLFDSGVISSHTLLSYGYFEARMKFPSGQGVWPAFWLLPNANYQGEIDIVEFVFNGGTEHQNMIHNNNLCNPPGSTVYWDDVHYNTQYGFWAAPSTLSPTYMVDDWHVVGCYWNEIDNTTTIYIDGFPVSQRRLGPYGQLSAIIFNMAMGGGWPTTNGSGQAWTQPVSLTDQVFEIDYIRTFQKSGKILTGSV